MEVEDIWTWIVFIHNTMDIPQIEKITEWHRLIRRTKIWDWLVRLHHEKHYWKDFDYMSTYEKEKVSQEYIDRENKVLIDLQNRVWTTKSL